MSAKNHQTFQQIQRLFSAMPDVSVSYEFGFVNVKRECDFDGKSVNAELLAAEMGIEAFLAHVALKANGKANGWKAYVKAQTKTAYANAQRWAAEVQVLLASAGIHVSVDAELVCNKRSFYVASLYVGI